MLSLIPATHVAAPTSSGTTSGTVRKAALLLFSVAALLAGGAEAGRGQSALDGFDPNANGTIRVVVVQPDGKILLGGEFTTISPNGGAPVSRNHIARLNPDGTLDTAFNPNANYVVFAIAVQADGKILAGGAFVGSNSIGGQTRNRIARLDPTTGLADSFDPNANEPVYAVAVQTDGKVLAGGDFNGANSIGGQARNHIARLDATTGLADSFDPNANSNVYAIAVQADGKILAGGPFNGANSIGGQRRNYIARLDATTGLADSFDPNANNQVASFAVQADGKILAGGSFTSIGGQTRNRIARLDATTGLADSFNPNANSDVASIAVQADGKILAGGNFNGANSIGGQTRNRIARLDATTGLADSFDPNASYYVNSIAVQADGKILAGGEFTLLNSIGGQTRNGIARLETDGRVDRTLDLNIVGGGSIAIAVQPDGKILIGGNFTSVLNVARNNIARVNPDGRLDMTFNPNANGTVISIAVQPDGKVLVGGFFQGANSIGGQTRNYMARLDGTTGLPDSFDPNVNSTGSAVISIEVQADGKILAAGGFDRIGGQTRNNIARLDPATGLADSFDPNANQVVISIAVQTDGKILAGGGFTRIGGQMRNNIARLDATTGLADSFDPNANEDQGVNSIAVQPDGKILAGGFFTSIGGQTRNYIARLDPATGLADSFNPDANHFVYTIALQADGRILVGGEFGSIGEQTRNHITRLDAATGLADSFNPNANSPVTSIAVQADGKILASGGFNSIGGQTRNGFARLGNDTVALQNLAVTRTSITWTRGGSSPHFTRVTFEYSPDNVNYTPLGDGIPQSGSSSWILTGLNFSSGTNFYIRARGHCHAGRYNGSESMTESVRNVFLMPAAQPLNLSTRMRVETGDNVGIGGFIIPGTAPKHVLLRAIGPSLAQSGVPNVLADPVLELHGPIGFVTTINDNWRDDPVQAALIQATDLPPSNDLESAIEARLYPAAYTAVMRGKNNTAGVALVEVYDLDRSVDSKLVNISTRAFVNNGDSRVIAGFILGNNAGDDKVIVRGLGPSLSALGIPNALANPTLELRDANGGLLIANNDWQDNPDQAGELIAAGLTPANQLESGIAATLSPGAYTALLAGVNSGTGVGLVEVYDRGPP